MDPKPTTIHSGHLCFRGGGVRGAQGSGAGDLATRRSLLCPSALPPLPCPALPLPALPPCPALPCLPCLSDQRALTGWETHTFRRAAGTGHEDPQPDPNPSQLWFVVQCGRFCVEQRKEAESKKAHLEGGFGGEP